ncbi:MAG: 16S rRNA (cytosine(1402)-N(4))-methyltransferase RsmH [Thermomicrobiales bacterium]
MNEEHAGNVAFEPVNEHGPTRRGHISVMADEVIVALAPRPGGVYIDGTFGGGGHARRIAELIQPGGTLICVDRDAETRANFEPLAARFPGSLHFVHGSYAEMARYAAMFGHEKVDGVLLDLGFSSFQIDDPGRGFSFMHEGPLDMRYDQSSGVTVRELLETVDEDELTRILYEYGEEPRARKIARVIVRERGRRKIEFTHQLANMIEWTVGPKHGSKRLHPATRTFQALRIAVNDELGEVERGVQAALRLLAPGGRLAVISFHSLEDRIVKRAFADAARGCVCPREVPVCVCGHVATVAHVGKDTRASNAEVAANPRARSARLRVVERLSDA